LFKILLIFQILDTKLLFISIQMLFFIELNFGVYFFFF